MSDCSPSGSSVLGDSPGKDTGAGCHALPSRGSSRPRDRTSVSCIAGRFLPLSHQGSPIFLYNTYIFYLFVYCLTSPLPPLDYKFQKGRDFVTMCVSDLNDLLVMKGQEWGEIYVIPFQIPEFCLCKDFRKTKRRTSLFQRQGCTHFSILFRPHSSSAL